MNVYTRFTVLASQLLSLLDAGKKLDMDSTHSHIRDKTIFSWLEEKFPERIDLSTYKDADLTDMQSLFHTWSLVIDERRKMEVAHNGLCLLIAYCLEAIEGDPNTIQNQGPQPGR
jgi:hypothetical protein